MSVSQLNCPSRRQSMDYPLHKSYVERFGPSGARTDYGMNGGASEAIGRMLHVDRAGIWMLGRRASCRRVTDGLTKTYLIGEKAMNTENYANGKDFGDRAPIVGWADQEGGVNSYVRFAARPPSIDRTGSCLACHDFGSAHATGWNAVFADGSVRSIDYAIDPSIHRAYGSMAGGETAPMADP